jgi:hypothetical protein
VSNDPDQQVTVRRLPDGDRRSAALADLNSWSLRLRLPLAPAAEFRAGDLVEIACPKTLYLGEVRIVQGDSMTVGIEHLLDRDAVALIRQVWHAPADGG